MQSQDGASITTANAGGEHRGEFDDLRTKVAQLEEALSSRIVIEQAKGALSERFQLSIDEAFELLRRSARSARTDIHHVAALVVNERKTPTEIAATLVGKPARRQPNGNRRGKW